MTNEEFVAQYDEEHHDYLDDRPHQWEATRAELLRRLSSSGAAVSASPQPSCPKCRSEDLEHYTHIPTVAQHVKCKSCLATFDTTHLHSFAQFFAAAPAQPETSRTYGDLPGSIRNMVEPHEWDNKNISEQRDYALDMVDFLDRELGNFRRNQATAQEQPYSRPECHLETCEAPEECKHKGICKFHYREARAQEQPVENSPCTCGFLRGSSAIGSKPCPIHSPQKGKP